MYYQEAVIVTEACTISITKLSIKDTVLRKTLIYTFWVGVCFFEIPHRGLSSLFFCFIMSFRSSPNHILPIVSQKLQTEKKVFFRGFMRDHDTNTSKMSKQSNEEDCIWIWYTFTHLVWFQGNITNTTTNNTDNISANCCMIYGSRSLVMYENVIFRE